MSPAKRKRLTKKRTIKKVNKTLPLKKAKNVQNGKVAQKWNDDTTTQEEEEENHSVLLIEPHITIIEISDDDDKDILESVIAQQQEAAQNSAPPLKPSTSEKTGAAKTAPTILTKDAVTALLPVVKKLFNEFKQTQTGVLKGKAKPVIAPASASVTATASVSATSSVPATASVLATASVSAPAQSTSSAMKIKPDPATAPALAAKFNTPKPCRPTVASRIHVVTPNVKKKKKNISFAQRQQNVPSQNIQQPQLSFDVVDLSQPQGRVYEPDKQRLVENALEWYYQQLRHLDSHQSPVSLSFAWKDGHFCVDCADENSHQFLIFAIGQMTSHALWTNCTLFVLPSGSVHGDVFDGRRCIVLYTNRDLLQSPYEFFRMLALQNPELNVRHWTAVHRFYLQLQLGVLYYFLVDVASYQLLEAQLGGVHFGIGRMLFFNLWPYHEMRQGSMQRQLMLHHNYT